VSNDGLETGIIQHVSISADYAKVLRAEDISTPASWICQPCKPMPSRLALGVDMGGGLAQACMRSYASQAIALNSRRRSRAAQFV